MELKVYLDFLARRWWLLILGPLLAGMAAYFVTQQMTPKYSATATVLINRMAVPGAIDYTDVLTSERLTNTYARLVERPPVLDEVLKRLNLAWDRTVLEKRIDVSTIKDTQLLEVTATDPDAVFAALLANTVSQAFADDNASQLAPVGTVTIAKAAEVPASPTSPKLFLNLSFAIVLGLIIAAGFGLLLDYLDDTVKTEEDIEALAGVPTLARISRFRPSTGPAFAADAQSRSAEAYRQLRTNVHFTKMGSDLKTIVITSANPHEGKSTTAANLATVLAQAGDRVILVDCDLRRSSLRKTFEAPNSFGLTGLLLNDIQDPTLALVSTRWKNLQMLPAGVLPPNPSELLTSARMMRVIHQLGQIADYVIFDTPPVLAVTDAIVLAARTDGTILVVEAGRTRTDTLRQAARTLTQANVRLFGVVLNKTKARSSVDYYYHPEADGKAVAAVEMEVEVPSARGGAGRSRQHPAATVEARKVAGGERLAAGGAPNRDAGLEQRLAALRSQGSALHAAPPQPYGAEAFESEAEALERERLEATLRMLGLPATPSAPASGERPSANGLGRSAAAYGYTDKGTWPAESGRGAPANGNGHGPAKASPNGHAVSNGRDVTPRAPGDAASANGNGHAAPAAKAPVAEQTAPLNAMMTDLLAQLDGTMGLIRSLRPEDKTREA